MVHCEAIVEEEQLQQNLCQCIKIIGGVPIQEGNTISVDYTGKPEKVIELFEHFPVHSITTISTK